MTPGVNEVSQSDPHRPQVSVPTCGQLQRGWDHSPTRSPVECSVVHLSFFVVLLVT